MSGKSSNSNQDSAKAILKEFVDVSSLCSSLAETH